MVGSHSFKRFSITIIFYFVISCSYADTAHDLTPEFVQGTIRVSAEEVAYLKTRKKDLVIFDVRPPQERKSKGWIEGSLPLPNQKTNAVKLSETVPDKSTPIMFYCDDVNCRRSIYSARFALTLGYKEIYWFRGGWQEWTQKGLPVVHPQLQARE